MAHSWKEKREAIRQAVIYALGLNVPDADGGSQDYLVMWEGRREANRWTRGMWCDLRLGAVRVLGRDEMRLVYDAATDSLQPTYGGQRAITVTVVISSDDQEDVDAVGTAGRFLRTRMERDEVREIL